MKYRIKFMLGGAVAALIVVAVPALAQDAARGDASRGEELFKKCVACHTLDAEGRNKVGPRLHGLFGRKAGGVADFKYSPALRDSTVVWTPETIDQLFAKGPDVFTPGSKMPLQMMPNPADRADLIAFLKRATAGP